MPFFHSSDKPNPYSSDPDVQLMLAFQKGNKTAFEALMRKYFPRILNFIYRYVGDREVAEDLAQEVFIRVYKSGVNYQPRSKFQTWVFTIAKNISLNELRKKKATTVSLDDTFEFDGDQLNRQIEDKRASVANEKMVQEEKAGIIRSAINSLPENQRMAVILRRYEQFSYDEIAETMNTSVKAVKSLLSRAKENLKNKLAPLIKAE